MGARLMAWRADTADPWTEVDYQRGVPGARPFTALG